MVKNLKMLKILFIIWYKKNINWWYYWNLCLIEKKGFSFIINKNLIIFK